MDKVPEAKKPGLTKKFFHCLNCDYGLDAYVMPPVCPKCQWKCLFPVPESAVENFRALSWTDQG